MVLASITRVEEVEEDDECDSEFLYARPSLKKPEISVTTGQVENENNKASYS